jgi:hypothetical protein
MDDLQNPNPTTEPGGRPLRKPAAVVQADFGPRVAPDLPGILRDLADAAERGDVTAIVFGYIDQGQYITRQSASLQNALVLSTLLQNRCINAFYKP